MVQSLKFLFNIVLLAVCTQFVFAEAPDWQDDPGGYEFVATMTAAVSDGGEQLSDTDDILAAFDDAGNVRGTSFALDVSFGPYAGTVVHEITLRSNDAGDQDRKSVV